MNWHKKAQQKLDMDQLNQLRYEIQGVIETLGGLGKRFPEARYYTTAENLDTFIKEGSKIYFIAMWEDVKDNKQYHYLFSRPFKTIFKSTVTGYIQSHGFDTSNEQGRSIPNLYILSEGKPVPVEKTQEIMTVASFADNYQNVIYKIQGNVLREIQSRRAEVYFKDHPLILELKSKIDNGLEIEGVINILNLLAVKQGIKEAEIPYARDVLVKYYWSKQSKEKFVERLQKAVGDFEQQTQEETDQTGRDPYLYYLDMDPNQEGSGKFLIDTDIPKAFQQWGDFPIVVRYHGGRMIYPASKVSQWLNPTDPNDDMAYNFENQLGGIRDMFIASKRQ